MTSIDTALAAASTLYGEMAGRFPLLSFPRTEALAALNHLRAVRAYLMATDAIILPTETPASETPKTPSRKLATPPASAPLEALPAAPDPSAAAFDEAARVVGTCLQTRSGEKPQSAVLENWAAVPFAASASLPPLPRHPSPEEPAARAAEDSRHPTPESAPPVPGRSADSRSQGLSSAHPTTPR